MGIFAEDLKKEIIHPTLVQLNQWTLATENLLLGTALMMSNLGETLSVTEKNQDNREHFFGLYSINRHTHRNIWDNHLALNSDLASCVRGFASQHTFLKNPEHELVANLSYATAIAWATYDAHLEEFPTDPFDLHTLAVCWYDNYPRNGHVHHQREEAISAFISGLKDIIKQPCSKPQLVA